MIVNVTEPNQFGYCLGVLFAGQMIAMLIGVCLVFGQLLSASAPCGAQEQVEGSVCGARAQHLANESSHCCSVGWI